MTFPWKVKIDVCLPGQDCPLVTLEIVWAHVRMQVTSVVVGDGRVVAVVVATFVGTIVTVTDGSNV